MAPRIGGYGNQQQMGPGQVAGSLLRTQLRSMPGQQTSNNMVGSGQQQIITGTLQTGAPTSFQLQQQQQQQIHLRNKFLDSQQMRLLVSQQGQHMSSPNHAGASPHHQTLLQVRQQQVPQQAISQQQQQSLQQQQALGGQPQSQMQLPNVNDVVRNNNDFIHYHIYGIILEQH